jgi:hypothetical protein
MRDARQIIRDQLKRRNCKPSHYAQREISQMAQQYLVEEGNRKRLEAEALAKIMASPKLRADYEAEGRKYEAKMARRLAKHV